MGNTIAHKFLYLCVLLCVFLCISPFLHVQGKAEEMVEVDEDMDMEDMDGPTFVAEEDYNSVLADLATQAYLIDKLEQYDHPLPSSILHAYLLTHNVHAPTSTCVHKPVRYV